MNPASGGEGGKTELVVAALQTASKGEVDPDARRAPNPTGPISAVNRRAG
jgi:hypothetical protein